MVSLASACTVTRNYLRAQKSLNNVWARETRKQCLFLSFYFQGDSKPAGAQRQNGNDSPVERQAPAIRLPSVLAERNITCDRLAHHETGRRPTECFQ